MSDKDNFQILRDERTKLVNQIADLQTENVQLREAVNTALQILKEDHIQQNKFRLGICGSQDIGHIIYALEKAV